ncbi:hypothetical protein ACQHIV_28930 [Kribbella sp. GL6]|uniref:hypothetical protein n=1 Tax=Kribbella sp. GL6 TaxID=3419765 RepID=UPI003CFC8CC4
MHITYASDEFLLATKLVAQRRKDAADIVVLAKRLHLENASASDLGQLVRRYYTDDNVLEFILDGNDTDRELHLLTVRAERLLTNHRSGARPEVPTTPVSAVRRNQPPPRERS